MSDEIDRTVLLERVESLLLQIQELSRGIPSDAKDYKFVKSKLQSTIGHLSQARFDLKFTPEEG